MGPSERRSQNIQGFVSARHINLTLTTPRRSRHYPVLRGCGPTTIYVTGLVTSR
jgi:hypothetical protein